MADSLSLSVMSAVVGALSTAEPQFHPRTTFPMCQTEQQRLHELYADQDQCFKEDPIYKSVIQPLGVFQRPWITNEETMGTGVVLEYAKETVTKAAKRVQRTGKALYEANVSPIDQALITYGLYSFQRLGEFKVWWLGNFRLEQGNFFTSIEQFDYVRALRQATRLCDVGFDRLRGHGLRLEALDNCEQKTMGDKIAIEGIMGSFLERNNQELDFWYQASLGLRPLIDWRHQITDLAHVLQTHLNFGGSKPITQIQYQLWKLDALDSELRAAFHQNACSRRLYQGQVSQTAEWATNLFASFFVGDAKDPRPFEVVSNAAQQYIKKSEADLEGFKEENPDSEQQRMERFKEAIEQDYFFLARQIALNGQALEGTTYNWENELNRLKDYKAITTTLAQIQDQFFSKKHELAQQLSVKPNLAIAAFFEKIDEAEYAAFQMRRILKEAYQSDLQRTAQGMEGYLQQVRNSAVEVAKSYLLQGRLGDAKSPFTVVMNTVRSNITTYCDHLREAEELLAGQPTNNDKERPETDNNKEGTQQQGRADQRATSNHIDELALQAHQHFNTPDDYCTFVESADFIDEGRIGIAIIFCRKNTEAGVPYWEWAREERELELFKEWLKLITMNPSFSKPYKDDLITELRESFRKKALTDLSLLSSEQSYSVTDMLSSTINSVVKSTVRKGARLIQEGAFFNRYGNFRESKFQLMFSYKLRSPENAFQFESLLAQTPSVSHESALAKEQKFFTPDEYRSFVESVEFTTNPGLAAVILKFHSTEGPEAKNWSWTREKEELQLYCTLWDCLKEKEATIPTAVQLRRDLINSWIKKVRTDHSEYRKIVVASSYVSTLSNAVISATHSTIRKTGRLVTLQSPISGAISFREEGFQRRIKEALGLIVPLAAQPPAKPGEERK